ncbi:ferric reductase-like transmembrane domain-containing protein [Pseudomonas marincola]|uniref:ferric reductase-like transmembrane domain-containing protein n=1 Tax=Pseudomonas marincola TaxID=437900 RepID=UPI0008E9A5A3|nr:ferric reductase-like transmembrane domain-containing protein [Pseudomonas marincola]SFT87122.1 Ferric reductase like transmembrane component [Pseudomonas marincola]
MFVLSLRIALCLLLPFGAIFLLGAMPGVNLIWDFSNASGFIAGVLFLLLFAYTGRPLAQPRHDGKFFMALHRDLGFVAALMLAVHIVVMLVDEPLVFDQLSPGAPWPMVAGNLATLILLLLVPLSLTAVRKRIWATHQHFRRWHYAASALVVILTAVHMICIGYYSTVPVKAAFWSLLTGLALAYPLFMHGRAHTGPGGRRRHTAYLATCLSLGVLFAGLLLAAVYSVLGSVDLPL